MKRIALIISVMLVFVMAIPAIAATSQEGLDVTFTFNAPQASAVYLAGSFNAWNPSLDLMSKGADGVWSITIELDPGTYQYKFVVDGVWTSDMDAVAFADDGFGGKNAVLIVKKTDELGDSSKELDSLKAQVAAIDTSFQYHGYARSGILMNSKGGQMDANIYVSDAWNTFRLGNESDTMVENVFQKHFVTKNGTVAKVHFLWAHGDLNNNVNEDIGNTNGGTHTHEDEDADTPDVTIPGGGHGGHIGQQRAIWFRESYAEIRNSPYAPDLTFWAGRRFYQRKDVHILDYYWRDLSGIGGGVEGIKLGDFAKLNLAYITNNNDTHIAGLGSSSVQRLVFMLDNIKLGSGNMQFNVAPGMMKDIVEGEKVTKTGLQAAISYDMSNFFGLMDGVATFGVNYGQGILHNLNNQGPITNGGFDGGVTVGTAKNIVDDMNVLRFVAHGVMQFSEKFEIMPAVCYQVEKRNYRDDNAFHGEKWLAVGARPIYHFNENFALQAELGYHSLKYDDGSNSLDQWSVAISPAVTLDLGAFTRPQLRGFVRYTKWDKGMNHPGGGPLGGGHMDMDDAFTYGIQMEAWW